MKTLATCLAFSLALLLALGTNNHLQVATSIMELKQKPVTQNQVVLAVGKTSMGDGLGAFYYWDSLATDVEDMVNLNIIKSDVTAIGAWKRVNVRTQQLPGGILFMNGGKKEYYVSRVTDANGEVTINLTTDNTATGPAIFNSIYINSCQVITPTTAVNNATTDYIKSTTTKTTTHGFTKANNQVVGVLGITILPYTTAQSSLTVNCTIQGL